MGSAITCSTFKIVHNVHGPQSFLISIRHIVCLVPRDRRFHMEKQRKPRQSSIWTLEPSGFCLLYFRRLVYPVCCQPARPIANNSQPSLDCDKAIKLGAVVEEMVRACTECTAQKREHAPRESFPHWPPCRAKEGVVKMSHDVNMASAVILISRALAELKRILN